MKKKAHTPTHEPHRPYCLRTERVRIDAKVSQHTSYPKEKYRGCKENSRLECARLDECARPGWERAGSQLPPSEVVK